MQAGTYTVTSTDMFGCSSSVSNPVTVTVNPYLAPAVTISAAATVICANTSNIHRIIKQPDCCCIQLEEEWGTGCHYQHICTGFGTKWRHHHLRSPRNKWMY